MRVVVFLIVLVAIGVALWTGIVADMISNLSEPEPPVKQVEKIALPQEPSRKDIRDVTPQGTLPGPKIVTETIARLPAIVVPEPEKPPLPPVLLRSVVVNAPGVIAADNVVLRIRGITPLGLDETCTTPEGKQWPCGRFARTAMRSLIRGRTVSCLSDTNDADNAIAKCSIGGTDIGAWLVKQGWAKNAGEEYVDMMKQAQTAKAGMWRIALP